MEVKDCPSHCSTEVVKNVITIGIFILNFLFTFFVTVYNEVTFQAYNRKFDYTNFGFMLVDLVLLIIFKNYKRFKWYKSKSDAEKMQKDKTFEVVETFVSEILVYPAMIFTTIGVATERVWENDYSVPTGYGDD